MTGARQSLCSRVCVRFRRSLPAAVLPVLLWGLAASAQVTASEQGGASAQNTVSAQDAVSTRPAFEEFELILQRNIFDPNRRRAEPTRRTEAPPRPQPVETVATEQFFLVGSLVHGGTAVAFFEGSHPEYRAALGPQDMIGGCRIAAIGTDRILLERDGLYTSLPVGRGLSRPVGGEWRMSAETSAGALLAAGSASPGTPSDSYGNTATPSSAGAPSGAGGDLLQRLMERRRQEMGQ